MSGPPEMLFEFDAKFVGDEKSFGTIAAKARFGFAGALFKVGGRIRDVAVGSIGRAHRLSVGELSPYQREIFERHTKQFESGSSGSPPRLPYAVSAPGEPPLSPTGIFAHTILFAVEREEQTVVVGAKARSKSKGQRSVPSVLEFGGDTMTSDTQFGRKVHVKPRPYMRPAMAAAVNRMASLFEGIL